MCCRRPPGWRYSGLDRPPPPVCTDACRAHAARGACNACDYRLSPAPDRALEIPRLPGDRGAGTWPRSGWVGVGSRPLSGDRGCFKGKASCAITTPHDSATSQHSAKLALSSLPSLQVSGTNRNRRFTATCQPFSSWSVLCSAVLWRTMWLLFSHTHACLANPPPSVGPAGQACLRAELKGGSRACQPQATKEMAQQGCVIIVVLDLDFAFSR